jgi:hypothetical protein
MAFMTLRSTAPAKRRDSVASRPKDWISPIKSIACCMVERKNAARMSWQNPQTLADLHLPKPNCLIAIATGQPLIIGIKCDRPNRILMPPQHPQTLMSLHIP